MIALFAIGTLAVTWRSISTRTKFAIPFITGGLRKSFPSSSSRGSSKGCAANTCAVEVVGYVGRAIAKDNTESPLVPYIMQSILLLIAPALFAASIYMTLGRVIRSVHGEQRSIIRPTRLTRLFVTIEIVSFFAQATGGGFQASKNFNKETAKNIILTGLVVQISGFGLFAYTALIWHMRMRRSPTGVAVADSSKRWEKIMIMLYTVSVLIMVRSVFRVIEYVLGADGYLMRHEWPPYVYDALPMLITVGVFAWWYPGRLDSSPVAMEDDIETGSDSGLESGYPMKSKRSVRQKKTPFWQIRK